MLIKFILLTLAQLPSILILLYIFHFKLPNIKCEHSLKDVNIITVEKIKVIPVMDTTKFFYKPIINKDEQ